MKDGLSSDAKVQEARRYFVYRMPMIRGACILAVIASHVSPLQDRFLLFCVPVFVLLAGFYLSLNPRNERALPFYRRTLKFLLVPYLAYSLFFAIPHVIRGATPGQLWRDFLSSNIEQHLWFMPVIIGLYLLHPWLRRVYRRSPVVSCVAAFILQLWAWPWAKSHGLPPGAATTLLSFMSQLGYFVAGYFVLDHVVDARRVCENWAGRLACVAVWLLWPCLGVWPGVVELPVWATRILKAGGFVAAFFLLAALGRPASRMGRMVVGWVERFGLYAYGVYLLHPIFISVAAKATGFIPGLDREGSLSSLVIFLVTAPATLLAIRWLANRRWGRYVT